MLYSVRKTIHRIPGGRAFQEKNRLKVITVFTAYADETKKAAEAAFSF
jgi:hypothetical protein